MKEFNVDQETGEIIEREDIYELVARDLAPLVNDDFIEKLDMLEALQQQVEMAKVQHKQLVKEVFKKYGIKSFKNDYITITYVDETLQQRVDTQKLKNDGLYDKYSKYVPVKESIRITKKGRND